MKLIRPKNAELLLNYCCPSCGAEHQATLGEVKFPGGVKCFCGEDLKFEKFKVNFSVDFSPKTPKIEEPKGELKYETTQRLVMPARPTGVSESMRTAVDVTRAVEVMNDNLQEDKHFEVVNTLIKLGYNRSEANRLFNKNYSATKTSDDIIRECLVKCNVST